MIVLLQTSRYNTIDASSYYNLVLLVLSVTPLAWSFSDLIESTMAVLRTLIESMSNG